MKKHAYIGVMLGVRKSDKEPQVMTTLVVADDKQAAETRTHAVLLSSFHPESDWEIDVEAFEVDAPVLDAANQISCCAGTNDGCSCD